ncbi:MAG TPA: hypothetical protein VNX25_05410, partial [Verrucomicrobiae bacterium]|nr:hypothetical protein [Verrucomicrobiae bacterium]
MRRLFALLVLSASFACSLPALAADRPQFVYPPDYSHLQQPAVRVVGVAPESLERVTVEASGGDIVGDATVPVRRGAFSFLFKPSKGQNTLRIAGEKETVLHLYYET